MEKLIFDKVSKIAAGGIVVMSDAELDYLDNLDHESIFYVSAPNPDQCGILDRWIVAKKDHPAMLQKRLELYGI